MLHSIIPPIKKKVICYQELQKIQHWLRSVRPLSTYMYIYIPKWNTYSTIYVIHLVKLLTLACNQAWYCDSTCGCIRKQIRDKKHMPCFIQHVNTSKPRQNGRHFANDIFKCIFLNENFWTPIRISLTLVPKGPINNFPALVQINAHRVTSRCVNQWWLDYQRIYASLGLNELKVFLCHLYVWNIYFVHFIVEYGLN